MTLHRTLLNYSQANISKFYDGTTVFLTGATGFVGKVVLEKLLRSCQGISKIYILVREKSGTSVNRRYEELISSKIFDNLRENRPEDLKKIAIIHGDIGVPDLGISTRDRRRLVEDVNVAFHSAATIKFNENLKDAFVLNTLGTKWTVELFKQMKQLKSAVHVSTAYCNFDKKDVKEVVYPGPCGFETVKGLVDKLNLKELDRATEKLLLQKNHPNTYTLTKAMGENVVLEDSRNIPTAIVRPSIVTASWREPYPGWIDNTNALTGVLMYIGLGTLRSVICNRTMITDPIPVDIVANTMIASAWYNVANRSDSVRVYNCTSGGLNQVSWGTALKFVQDHARQWPSKHTKYYPKIHLTTNPALHNINHLLFHLTPAVLSDAIAIVSQKKPSSYKKFKKTTQLMDALEEFFLNEWNFSNDNQKDLIAALKRTEDGHHFLCDIRNNFSWDEYFKIYHLGIRKYLYKDETNAEPSQPNWTTRLLKFRSHF